MQKCTENMEAKKQIDKIETLLFFAQEADLFFTWARVIFYEALQALTNVLGT